MIRLRVGFGTGVRPSWTAHNTVFGYAVVISPGLDYRFPGWLALYKIGDIRPQTFIVGQTARASLSPALHERTHIIWQNREQPDLRLTEMFRKLLAVSSCALAWAGSAAALAYDHDLEWISTNASLPKVV